MSRLVPCLSPASRLSIHKGAEVCRLPSHELPNRDNRNHNISEELKNINGEGGLARVLSESSAWSSAQEFSLTILSFELQFAAPPSRDRLVRTVLPGMFAFLAVGNQKI